LPSFTARRPKVDSAMSAWRQNSEIWLRIWSFFIALGLGRVGGQPLLAWVSYHDLPTGGMRGGALSSGDRQKGRWSPARNQFVEIPFVIGTEAIQKGAKRTDWIVSSLRPSQ
jgi:hypothetical protein